MKHLLGVNLFSERKADQLKFTFAELVSQPSLVRGRFFGGHRRRRLG